MSRKAGWTGNTCPRPPVSDRTICTCIRAYCETRSIRHRRWFLHNFAGASAIMPRRHQRFSIHYHVVGFDEICREFVESVVPCVADTFVDPCTLRALAPSAFGVLILSGELPLLYGESFFELPKCPPRVETTDTCPSLSNRVAVALDSKVYRYALPAGGRRKHLSPRQAGTVPRTAQTRNAVRCHDASRSR